MDPETSTTAADVDEATPLISSANHSTRDGKKAGQGSFVGVFLPMAIGLFLVSTDGTIVVSSFAAIGSDLNHLQRTSWISTGYMLTLTSFQPLYGRLALLFGGKRMLLFSYFVFGLGCLLCGLARSMNELIAARALAGAGGGGMSTVVAIIMTDLVPLKARGTWQGVINLIFCTGSAVGGPLGGFLADTLGWRWSFLIQVPATVLASIAVYLLLDLPHHSHDVRSSLARIDFLGALALISTVFCLLVGLDNGGNISWSSPSTISFLSASLAFFILFCFIETRVAAEPFAPMHILTSRKLAPAYWANFFGVGASMSLFFHAALYLQAAHGMSASEAGAWLLPSVAGGAVGSLGGGLVVQRTGTFKAETVLGYSALFVGAFSVMLVTGAVCRSMVGFAFGFFLAGLGNGSAITTCLVALIANAGPEDQAIATAVSYLFRSLGSVLALSCGSAIVQAALRTQLLRNLPGNDVEVEEIIRRVKESLDFVNQLDPTMRGIVREAYGRALTAEFAFTCTLALAAVGASVFIRKVSLGK